MLAEETLRAHRKRLEGKFAKGGISTLDNTEIVEVVLTHGAPDKDRRPLAQEVIKRFRNLRGLLSASSEELLQIEGLTHRNVLNIQFVREVASEFLREKIIDKPTYKSAQEVFDYLYCSMRDLKKEVFKVIYLNSHSQIIDIADLFEGTVESTPVHPREIIESAIKYNAVSVIFVHNHPSGDPTPSQSDKQLTRDLVFIGNVTQIKVLDHIIIGENRYFSFADAGLIKKYEDDFLNIRIRKMLQANQYQHPN